MPYDATKSDHEISGHSGNDDQTYIDFLSQMVSIPDEDTSVPGENVAEARQGVLQDGFASRALKEAKDSTDERYHPALEIMLKYESPNGASVNFKKITLAVRAGHAIIRPDLKAFTEKFLFEWLRYGLWPVSRNIQPQPNENIVQCSKEMNYLRIGKDQETMIMIRRIARIRLYYWYEKERIKMLHSQVPVELERGVDTRTRAMDAILEYFLHNHNITTDEVKENYRSWFQFEKSIGKRWCELVQYLGEGILVICGKEVDTQMYEPTHLSDRI